MTDNENSLNEAATVPEGRRLRADAQRNIEILLQAAAETFASSGVDVPIREIAETAGVGVGTLYRHFPTRSDLIVAVFRKEVEECVAAISSLTTNYPPGEALARWVKSYVDFITARRGLAAALNSGDPALEALPEYFQQRLGPNVQCLLDAATAKGEIRDGIASAELIHAIAMLCVPSHCGTQSDPHRMVGLLVDGLRYGAK